MLPRPAQYSSIGGGVANRVTGERSVIVGGRGLTLNGDGGSSTLFVPIRLVLFT
ncbi:MAG: hypothetical protein KDD67_06890 [Ignavibacteriae bacterium]|nr:hypothetical protein [Ignavibacteriota bacterium]MCB9215203.1 hypothetical protein [Ignavibacteria bacterium]